MKVVVDGTADSVAVHGAEELTTLSVELRTCLPGRADSLLGDLGRIEGTYAWLHVELLRARIIPPEEPEWSARFDDAMRYARSKGWTDPSGVYVRAHVVSNSEDQREGSTDHAR